MTGHPNGCRPRSQRPPSRSPDPARALAHPVAAHPYIIRARGYWNDFGLWGWRRFGHHDSFCRSRSHRDALAHDNSPLDTTVTQKNHSRDSGGNPKVLQLHLHFTQHSLRITSDAMLNRLNLRTSPRCPKLPESIENLLAGLALTAPSKPKNVPIRRVWSVV